MPTSPTTPTDPNKSAVRREFTANADRYTTSEVHAKGASLNLLVERTQPEPTWRVLDVATGAGHTAFAFAPHVAHVVASDLTPRMLEKAEEIARERGLDNLSFEVADAEALPFDDSTFDLVTTRIAPHHFPNVDRFLAESHRVLKPSGLVAIVDNIVPNDDAGSDAVNAFEKLRDPSHGRCLTMDEWRELISDSGFEITHEEIALKRINFEWWAGRVEASPLIVERLRIMLQNAPPSAATHFEPITMERGLHFHLREGFLIGRRQG